MFAALARGRGIPVRLFLVGGEPRSEDARAAAEKARSAGLALETFEAAALETRGVVVDAMLGTGISGAPRAAFAEAIDAVNALGVPVLALDVPSGVNSDTGHAEGPAIRATWTISFITAKAGLFTGDGAVLAGERTLNDLAVPLEAYAAAGPAIPVLDRESLLFAMPSRAAGAHKGDFGRCLLVGGDDGMGGAIILAAEAALRTGVGLARAATRAAHIPPLLARRPECMATAVDHRNHLLPLLDWPSAVVIGPGLGQAPWGEQMLHGVLASDLPLLVDADALNLLAGDARPLPDGSIITPHPGEAARLLGCRSADIQADRFAAATSLAQRFNAVVVLKGQGTIVAKADQSMLCAAGNPGMASGGMGDVLSGILGSLLAQGLSAWDAACLGVPAVTGLSLYLDGEEAMVAFGQRLAAALDAGASLYLSGELGAGKTTLSRGIARGLGHEGAVKSPTYTLVEPYQDLRIPLYHFDLYRLGDPEELEYMGLREYFDGSAVVLVEWPERGAGFLPDPDLRITIALEGAGRRVDLQAGSPRGEACLATMA